MKQSLPFVWLLCAACAGSDPKLQQIVYDEASLKTFVLATHATPEETSMRQLDSVLQHASGDSTVFRQTIAYLETPFANPNSSYRNQNLYLKILQAKTQTPWFIDDEKKIAKDKIKLLQQNNVGDAANDFTYITPAGYKRKMYDIQSKYVLLYFNNPECPACRDMKNTLKNSSVITDNIKSGKLTVLSMYTDKDEKLWLDHLSEYPGKWIQGRDDDEFLYRNKIYDVRAIPTIYLLDKEKIVLLKDCLDVAQIEEKLTR